MCMRMHVLFESLKNLHPETLSGCEVKRLSVHGGCLGIRGDEGRANLR